MNRWKSRSKKWAVQLLILSLVIPFFSGTGYVPKAEAASSGNMLNNAGFELISGGKPVGWQHSAGQLGTDFGISDQEKHSGMYSIFIDHSTGEGLPNWEPIESLPVKDTEEYEFSVWIKIVDPEMAGRPLLNLDFFNENNGWIGAPHKKMEGEEFTGDWQHFTYRFKPLEGAKSVKPYLMMSGGTGRVYLDDVSFVQLNDGPQPVEGTYRIWTAPSTMSLKRDAAPLSSNEVKLEMAGREYQSGQVLLTADNGYVNITEAAISDLSSGSTIIPASDIEVLVQHYVKTTAKSNGAHEPGWYPDALIPYSPYMDLHGSIQVESGNNQAIWFTVKTEANTPAGVYNGTISVTANGNVEQVPITVKVRDFALPEENHAQTAFAVWGWMLPYGYPGLVEGSPEFWDIMENYYEFLLNYHVTPTALPIPTDDYDQYVIDAAPYINDPRVSAYNLPYTVGDFESGRAQELVNDLKSKGLLDKAYYYLGAEIDEPTTAMFPKVIERSQQIAAIDPNLRHIVTTGLHPALIDDVNTFTPLFREFESKEYLQQVAEFKADGGNIWWYGCVVPSNPYPSYHLDDDLISARLVPWMQHSYDIEGNLYWAVNIYGKWTGTHYTERNIWNDPLAFPGANGDGYILYPGAKYGMNSPIATLRLQAIRDGNQDYEYLWLLEDRINQAAQQLGIEVSAKELIQPYYDRLFTNVKSFTKNAEELQQVRSEVADFIEELALNPQALVIFNDQPNEYAKKEVVVFAEKGTEVSINNVAINAEAIPGNSVSDRYSYIMDFNLGMNEVAIKLKKGAVERTVTKHVIIKSRTLEPIMQKRVIHNFPDQQSISGITTEYGVTLLGITDEHATGDGKALKVKIPTSNQESYPGIRIPVSQELQDFTWAETVELDIFNASNEPRDIFIKFFDKDGAPSDHRMGTIIAGSNHLSFDLSELKNNRASIATILFWTLPGNQEAELYFSDLHLLGVDTEAMKQYELNSSQVVPYVDGKLNEPMWQARTSLTHKTGTSDNEASVSFHYNDEYLFVAAAVKDQHVINSGAANPWDDDSLEIYVDGTGKQGAYDDHTARYVFRAADPQVHIYRETPKANEKIKYSYAATAEGYNMEIAIPWRSLDINPVEGNIIGLTAHVNDKDVDNSSLAASGKLSLTEDISQDDVSSSAWMPKKFVKEKQTYNLEAVNMASMNIDGIIDEAAWNTNWNIGYMAFGNLLDETSGGRLGLLWSPTHLYAAFDVKDGNIHVPKARPVWEETSVELFVDSEFVQGVRDDRTHQYTIRVDDPEIYYNGAPNANLTQDIIQKSTRTADGYQVEMAIPWTTIGITAEEGRKIGVTAHINVIEPSSTAALSLTDNGIMDGASTVNYVAFEMKALTVDPVEPVDPSNPPYTGGNPDSGSKPGEYVVKQQDIALDQPVIVLGADQEAAVLLLDILKQLHGKNKSLTIEQGDAQLVLSPEWIDELLKSSEAEGSEKLKLELRALAEEEGQSLASLAAKRQYADVSLPDKVWEVLVKWTNGDKEQAAKPFKAPLTLSLLAAKDKLANYYVYQIGADGELIYMDEKVTGDRLTVQLLQGGQIAVLVFVKKFDDLSKVQWAQEAIRELAARQIIKGTTTAKFAPSREITRAEFTALLARAIGLAEGGSKTFADISPDAWYAGVVSAAAQAGLVNGQGDNRFNPQASITREEMAVMLKRALEWQTKQAIQASEAQSYADDAQISAWAKEAIRALAEQGIMIGRGNNNFAPKASVNRAEAAQAIFNFLNKK
ncbi:glycoside hydrolase domain-containing protein [Paenibacillus sp. GXUN7292]|uniref:glycoside hydrolase domain-containing protein n=1 Tax=Paenibacillus sp. GXUN7292 TaxID=3422499 RepID=UPI003D7D7030